MTTLIHRKRLQIDLGTEAVPPSMSSREDGESVSRLTTEQVWRELERGSFAVVTHVTPSGEPGSSDVIYKAVKGRLYVAIAPESWKARHIPPERTFVVYGLGVSLMTMRIPAAARARVPVI